MKNITAEPKCSGKPYRLAANPNRKISIAAVSRVVRLLLVRNPAAVSAGKKNHQQDDEYDRVDRRNEAYIVHDNFLLCPTPYSIVKTGIYLPEDEISHRSNLVPLWSGIVCLSRFPQRKNKSTDFCPNICHCPALSLNRDVAAGRMSSVPRRETAA